MRAQHIKTWIERVGFTLALLCAAWAMYVEIASNGKDLSLINAWWKVTFGILLLTWVLSWIVGKYSGPKNSN